MPPLKVEYAKSSRSKCQNKQCAQIIEKGEVRIGTGGLMPGAEEYSFKFRHLCCFTKRQLVALKTIDQLEGFDDLEEVDQELMKRLIKGDLVDDFTLRGNTGECADGATPAAAPAPKAKEADGSPAKKRAKKDKDAPKAAKTAYAFFQQSMRTEVKAANAGMGVKEINAELKNLWQELGDDEGRTYREMEKEDRKRYDKEFHAYLGKSPAASPAGTPAATPAGTPAGSPTKPAAGGAPPLPARPRCTYGADCYMKNEEHKRTHYHPGDKDCVPAKAAPKAKEAPAKKAAAPAAAVKVFNDPKKPKCQWGSKCFRRNNAEVCCFEGGASRSLDNDPRIFLRS